MRRAIKKRTHCWWREKYFIDCGIQNADYGFKKEKKAFVFLF
jgi:hypothetical protein